MSNIRDITIILGPAGQDRVRRELSDVSNETGRSINDLHLESMQGAIREISERTDDKSTKLDELFSTALRMEVRVDDVFVTYYFDGYEEIKYPAFMVFPEKIIPVTETSLKTDLSDPAIRDVISNLIEFLFKVDWVRINVAYSEDIEQSLPTKLPESHELDPSHIIVIGEFNDVVAFIRRDEAISMVRIWGAIRSSKTWGIFRNSLGKDFDDYVVKHLENRWEDLKEGIEPFLEDDGIELEQAFLKYYPREKWFGALPSDNVKFDPYDIPAFENGWFPLTPKCCFSTLNHWLPSKVQKLGRNVTGFDYDGLEIPWANASNVVKAMAEEGYFCIHDQKIVEGAFGNEASNSDD